MKIFESTDRLKLCGGPIGSGFAILLTLVMAISAGQGGGAISSAQAQEQKRESEFFRDVKTDSSIGGFVIPMEVNGVKVQELRGGKATKSSPNRISINRLQVQTYGEGGMVMASPKAEFLVKEQKLSTTHGVQIDDAKRTITAECMEWDLKTRAGTFSRNVRVELRDFTF